MPRTHGARLASHHRELLLLCLVLVLTSLACGPRHSVEELRRQQEAGNFAETIVPLQALLAEQPDDLEVNYLYGLALTHTDQAGLAVWSLRKAMRDPHWLVPAGLQLAANAYELRENTTVVELTGQILEVEPDNVPALLLRARARAQAGVEREETLADVERILELDPDNSAALEPQILVMLAEDRPEDAARAIEELGERLEEQELSPDLLGWHCATSALFADESGMAELAAERWAECVERFPDHPNVVRNAVDYYDAQQDFDRAYAVLRGALDAAPNARGYRVQVALRLRMRGDADAAEAVLLEGTESEVPELAALAWVDLVKHYQEVGDYAAAAEAGARALALGRELGGPHPQLLLDYADALLLAGELEQALEIANEMTLTAHQEMIRARVAQERGDPAQALVHFDRAFMLWPDNPWARYYAALAAEAVGDFDKAIDEYRYSIRVNAGATDARTRLGRLHLAEGRLSEALSMLRIQEQQSPLDLEGQLFSIRLWSRLGNPAAVDAILDRLRSDAPNALGTAVAEAARGAAERAGPNAAVVLLASRVAEGVDYTNPDHADALRALVRYSRAPGQLGQSLEAVELAIALHPTNGTYSEILGLWQELSGARDSARAAYERALELGPDDPRSMAGLARVVEKSDPARALALFDRAASADPTDPDHEAGGARALLALGRAPEAEERLEQLLAAHPYQGDAARQLVELQLARGFAGERTEQMARRAVRFQAGPQALELLSRVYQLRGDDERARLAAQRAQALRRRLGPTG